ncbi:Uncharacterised protein [Serratia ficaria]|nr:Uncharacterised protein [Serratia ficaria]
MCGKPAVPNISARPNESADIGSDTSPPGLMMAIPFGCTFTASANSVLKSKLTDFITISAIKLAPASSSTALIICTQVVASMPPNSTYSTIRIPTRITATW